MICTYHLLFQLSGLPETGASLSTSSKAPQAAVAADADADLQARWAFIFVSTKSNVSFARLS